MKRKKIFVLNLLLILVISAIFMPISQATVENTIYKSESSVSIYEPNNSPVTRIGGSQIIGKEFFIKNVCTGQYLDVSGGIAANGTNVQQYKYNGTVSQRWYISYNGDETFTIFTRLGATQSYVYALDISNGSTENYANVQIYEYNGTNSQKFKISVTENDALVFSTAVSNYSKAIVLNGPTYIEGGNIDQYTYQGHVNEQWILEPVVKDASLGVDYAKANYNKYVFSYPDMTGYGGDCANFVSQCMLSSGIHYQNDWYVYRKNGNYSKPTNVFQLNNTWELSDPSPWISARQFRKYWVPRVTIYAYTTNEIAENPNLAMNLNMVPGDVIQLAEIDESGKVGNAWHTMYVTGTRSSTYLLTYHSSETIDKRLSTICMNNLDSYLIFYKMI